MCRRTIRPVDRVVTWFSLIGGILLMTLLLIPGLGRQGWVRLMASRVRQPLMVLLLIMAWMWAKCVPLAPWLTAMWTLTLVLQCDPVVWVRSLLTVLTIRLGLTTPLCVIVLVARNSLSRPVEATVTIYLPLLVLLLGRLALTLLKVVLLSLVFSLLLTFVLVLVFGGRAFVLPCLPSTRVTSLLASISPVLDS